MAEISFSTQDTGACPYCLYNERCHIQDGMIEFLEEEVDDTRDDEMEIVIYRCPEFETSKEKIYENEEVD